MNVDRVRTAVALHVTGTLSEAEAARRAGISRARLRHYARTCGTVVAAPSADAPEEPPSEV
ncbi:hypothetical protein [Natronomonas sp.]|uniref:hypothetical protein n=1 Tax=Natronomonas sp. TaxID=2184060 RepID=UPI00398A2E26